jgi:hypothetical protein
VAYGEEVKALLRNLGALNVSEQRGVCSAEGGRRSEKNEDETKTKGRKITKRKKKKKEKKKKQFLR